jgi:hypothetical protein
MGKKRHVYRLFAGKPAEKRGPGRPRRMWVHNIKMNISEIGLGGVDWIGRAQDRDWWSSCECGNKPPRSIKC